MSTHDVVIRLRRERARLLRAVDALGASAATVPVTGEGGWTAKDVLAHLVHYAGQIAFALGAPETPPPYVLGVTERLTGQEWNERAVNYWRDVPLPTVRSEFERVAAALIECAGLRTDDEMNAVGIAWAGPQPLWKFIGTDTFLDEWPAHARQIEAAAR
jgi:hypothetical protein